MREREPSLKRKLRKMPKNVPFWYLLFMLLAVMLWQAAVGQYAVRTIPYSDFKKALKNKEVLECLVKEDAVEGKIQPKNGAVETPATSVGEEAVNKNGSGPPKAFLFRAIRVEDPKLAEELEAAGVKFTGARPNFLSQVLLSWILPIGLM